MGKNITKLEQPHPLCMYRNRLDSLIVLNLEPFMHSSMSDYVPLDSSVGVGKYCLKKERCFIVSSKITYRFASPK